MIDLQRIRNETPAAARRAYMHNAGSALMPVPVVEAMKRHIDLEAEIGGYAAAAQEDKRLQAVYGSIARLINAAPTESAITENANVAWQMAFYALSFQPGDRILTAEAEYAADADRSSHERLLMLERRKKSGKTQSMRRDRPKPISKNFETR